jgi:hypothetical protein
VQASLDYKQRLQQLLFPEAKGWSSTRVNCLLAQDIRPVAGRHERAFGTPQAG